MADYTYSQLSQMQQDAVDRVREMRKRAKLAAEDAAKKLEICSVDPAQDVACPKKSVNANCPVYNVQQNENTNSFSADAEADKALLLSLCFLLQAEKADEELLLAMLYILT